jgi:hypothetical protein
MGVLLKAGATPGGCARLLLLLRLDCATLVRGGPTGAAPAALLEAWHAKQRLAQVRTNHAAAARFSALLSCFFPSEKG